MRWWLDPKTLRHYLVCIIPLGPQNVEDQIWRVRSFSRASPTGNGMAVYRIIWVAALPTLDASMEHV